jgi:hypothetical protein
MLPKCTKGSCNLASPGVRLVRLCYSTGPANDNQPVNGRPYFKHFGINNRHMTQRAIISICSVRWCHNHFHSWAECMICVRCWNNMNIQSSIKRHKSTYNCKFSRTTKEYQWNGSRITMSRQYVTRIVKSLHKQEDIRRARTRTHMRYKYSRQEGKKGNICKCVYISEERLLKSSRSSVYTHERARKRMN